MTPFLEILAILSVAACAAAAGYFFNQDVIRWFGSRFDREAEKYRLAAKRMLKHPDEKGIRIVFGVSLGLCGFFWLLVIPGILLKSVTAIVFFELGWRAPAKIVRLQYRRRLRRFQDQLIDALTLVSNSLRAGLSLNQALQMAGQEMPDPSGEEYRHLISQQQFGQSLEAGLQEMAERLPHDDFRLVVETVLILKETGGNMAETFDTITSTMRERHRVTGKIRTLTAQGVFQAVIIGLMPVGLLLMFNVIAPKFVAPLFDSPLGWGCLGLVLILELVGIFSMKKIVSIKV